MLFVELLKRFWKEIAVVVAIISAFVAGTFVNNKDIVEVKTVDEAKMSEIIASEKEKMILVFTEDYKKKLSEELQKYKAEKSEKVITITERKKDGSTKETKIEEKKEAVASETKVVKQEEEKKVAKEEVKEKESASKETVVEKKIVSSIVSKTSQPRFSLGLEVAKPAKKWITVLPQAEILYSVKAASRVGSLPLWVGVSYQFGTSAIGVTAHFEF
jgi:hypothetical protein